MLGYYLNYLLTELFRDSIGYRVEKARDLSPGAANIFINVTDDSFKKKKNRERNKGLPLGV